ncbi:MAG: hypothetical protein HY508_12245 [Acidobacteria bacterium]|nr:hypothetical protein [Acidobacteriota bacterium]
MGIYFLQLSQDDQEAVAKLVEQIKPYKRRGGHVSRRLHAIVRLFDYEGNWHEVAAETVSLSIHGGVRAHPHQAEIGLGHLSQLAGIRTASGGTHCLPRAGRSGQSFRNGL